MLDKAERKKISEKNYKFFREKLKSLGWKKVASKEEDVIKVEGAYAKIKYRFDGRSYLERHTVNKLRFYPYKDDIMIKIANLPLLRLSLLEDVSIESDKNKKSKEVKYLDW